MWSLLYTRQIKVLLMKPSSATTLKTRCFYYQIWKTKKVFPHSHSNWKCTEFARLVQQCDQVSPAWSSRTSCPSWKCHCKLIIQKHICGNKKKKPAEPHTYVYVYAYGIQSSREGLSAISKLSPYSVWWILVACCNLGTVKYCSGPLEHVTVFVKSARRVHPPDIGYLGMDVDDQTQNIFLICPQFLIGVHGI